MRQDKCEQVLIVLGTLFYSVFGMMAPSAWAATFVIGTEQVVSRI